MKYLIFITLILAISHCSVKYAVSTKQVDQDIRQGHEANESFANALKEQFKNAPQPEGFCELKNFEFPISNKDACGNDQSNIGWNFQFWFDETESSYWTIDFGTDFARGAALWVNGEFQLARIDELNWQGKWDSESVIRLEYQFPPGNNHIQLIGSENCCDGQIDVRFSRNGKAHQSFTKENLECAIPAPNSFMSMESRPYSGIIEGECFDFAEHLIETFHAAEEHAEGFCELKYPEWPVNNHKDCNGPDQNIIWKFHFEFQISQLVNIEFQFGLDFGKGTAIFINREWKQTRTDDLFWNNDWNHEDVLTIKDQFGPGTHLLELYGLEHCCDGNHAIRYKVEGEEDWTDLTATNWSASLPTPPPSFITVETRYHPQSDTIDGDGSAFSYNLYNTFKNAASNEKYCSMIDPNFPLQNSVDCNEGFGSDRSIVWRIQITLNEPEGAEYSFRFGTDFGKGTAWFLNGELIDQKKKDLWWKGNWDSADVFYLDFTAHQGLNEIAVFGAEGCCDGQHDAQFKRGEAEFQSINNLGRVIEEVKPKCGGNVEETALIQENSKQSTLKKNKKKHNKKKNHNKKK